MAQRTSSPRDVTDEQWELLTPLLGRNGTWGRPRTVDRRAVVNAIFYSVRYYFDKWRDDGTWQAINDALREQVRRAAGRAPEPTTAIIDSQSMKTTEAGGVRGCDDVAGASNRLGAKGTIARVR